MFVEGVAALSFCDVADYVRVAQKDAVRADRVEGLSADWAGDGDWVGDPAGYCIPLDDWKDWFFYLHWLFIISWVILS